MPRIAVLIAIGLMLVGALGYALTAQHSLLFLIPALVGVVMGVGGLWAMAKDSVRRHVMHLNTILSLVLVIGTSFFLPMVAWNFFSDPMPAVALADLLILSALFLYFAIRSFLVARAEKSYTATVATEKQCTTQENASTKA